MPLQDSTRVSDRVSDIWPKHFPFLSGISDIGTRKSRLFDLVENFQAPIWDQRTELYPITRIQIHDPSRAVRNADTLDSTQNSNKIKLNMFGKFQVETMS